MGYQLAQDNQTCHYESVSQSQIIHFRYRPTELSEETNLNTKWLNWVQEMYELVCGSLEMC